jgi:hypothetical protein
MLKISLVCKSAAKKVEYFSLENENMIPTCRVQTRKLFTIGSVLKKNPQTFENSKLEIF